MRKALALLLMAFVGTLALATTATAHPLGNFTTNRYAEVVASGDRLYIVAVVDLAEIPTYQARADLDRLGRTGYAGSLAATLRLGLDLRVNGVRRALHLRERRVAFPKGVAGLHTTRLEALFDAGPLTSGSPATLEIENRAFAMRIGWKEIVVRADRGAELANATAPSRSVTDRLHSYPKDLLHSPLERDGASARVTGADNVGVAPTLGPASGESAPVHVADSSEGGFAALVGKHDLSAGVVVVALLLALFWGAAHALTPGHGKAIVAGYLVGTRGRPVDAVLLGGIVTVTHTAGVFALGLVTLGLSTLIVPEQLYPWLTLVSGLLVVAVGGTVLAQRLQSGGWDRHHQGDHDHSHDHADQPHYHGDHAGHGHAADHHHEQAPAYERRGLVGVGVAAGILPCPSALVVLLGAIALHRVGFGLALIVAFSLGLASTITLIGLVAVFAKRIFGRLSLDGPIVRTLPAVSALAILAVGVVLTVRAIPAVV